MIKTLVFAAALAVTSLAMVATAPAATGTVRLTTAGKPVATFTVPTDWLHKFDKSGNSDLLSPDDAVTLHVGFVAKLRTLAEILQDLKKDLPSDKAEILSIKSGKTIINNKSAIIVQIQIRIKGTNRVINLTATEIPANSSGAVRVIVFGSAESLKAHEAEVGTLFDSLKIDA